MLILLMASVVIARPDGLVLFAMVSRPLIMDRFHKISRQPCW